MDVKAENEPKLRHHLCVGAERWVFTLPCAMGMGKSTGEHQSAMNVRIHTTNCGCTSAGFGGRTPKVEITPFFATLRNVNLGRSQLDRGEGGQPPRQRFDPVSKSIGAVSHGF